MKISFFFQKVIEELSKNKKSKPVEVYQQLLEKKLIDLDEKQNAVIDLMQKVFDDVKNYSPSAKSSGFFGKVCVSVPIVHS